MSSVVNPLASAARIAYGLGLAICFGTPGVIAMLLLSGAIAPGTQMPEGLVQQVGYLFTGLVFLDEMVLGQAGMRPAQEPVCSNDQPRQAYASHNRARKCI